MIIIITEEQKKKLFTPKGLSNDENNRYLKLNQEQPIRDGKPINQYDYKGNKQGYWEEYYSNGQLKSKGPYINGKEDGYWEEYYDNGELYSKGNYINGLKQGRFELYSPFGLLWFKHLYKDGIRINQYDLTETIKASEAYNNMDSFKTLEYGKRGVAFIVMNMSEKDVKNYILNSIKKNDFGFIKIKENPYEAMIIYRTGYRQDAEELYKIAKKYGGFLSGHATYEDSKRIGELLMYDTDDINSYLNKNYVNGVLKEGKVYSYNINQSESDKDYILYEFKNKGGFDFKVQFINYRGDVWEREYYTIQKGLGLLNTNDVYNIIETVTNITIDFIKKYEPEKIKINHIRQNKEVKFGMESNKPSKRALLNQRYLKPAIDKLPNYVYILNDNLSIISKI